MRKKLLFIVPTVLAAAVLVVLTVIWVCNEHTLELSIPEEQEVCLEYGQDYEEPEVTALYRGSILNREGTKVEVRKEGSVDVTKTGAYEVTYRASYKGLTAESVVKVAVEDHESPVIELVSDPAHFTSPIAEYEEEGYTASDNYDGDLTDKVIREERDGTVIYTVSDSSGNETTVCRKIVYKDAVAPEIILTGGSQIIFEAGSDFKDPGFQAADDCDGDLTKQVKTEGSADGYTLGEYILTYRVEDSSQNVCEIERHVSVVDTAAPVISLSGDRTIYVRKGDGYEDPGYQAWDSFEGDKTGEVSVKSNVNMDKPGVYSVSYAVSDQSGNHASVSRTVYVYEKQSEANTVNPGDKVVYLTFDDGPGRYTEELLDVLDRYGVKATFFVTNQFPAYQDLIGEEYRRGHTVAIHTCSHVYSDIYSSQENYFADLQKMRDICYAQTGEYPTILRFPGGSSNLISANYCPGIMSVLVRAVEMMGYQYCDWNVVSGDAGETTSTSQIAANVIDGIKKYNVSVVLQHDIHGFSVDAVEEILAWGLANGYTFLPMDDTTPMVHHSVNN